MRWAGTVVVGENSAGGNKVSWRQRAGGNLPAKGQTQLGT
jgi:hypothetical protein